jgi:hypothetical protein
MTKRRQALCSREPLATCVFLSLILVFLFALPSSLIAIDKTKSRPDGQGGASVGMPVNLPDGRVYDKVFGPTGNTQQTMEGTGGALLNSLMPSALPQFAFDGGTGAAQESAPETVGAAPPMPDQTDTPDTSRVNSAPPEASQADQTYPVLPLTVVPKPDSFPLASLKAPDANQRIAVLALALALLSAVTFFLWRHHRRDYASPRRIGRRI